MWTNLSVFTCYYLLLFFIDSIGAKECLKSADCQCVIEGTEEGINLNGVQTTSTNVTSSYNAIAYGIVFNPCGTVNFTNSADFTTFGNKTLDTVLDGCNDTSSICLSMVVVQRINIGHYQDLEFKTDDNGVYLSSYSNGWSTIIRLHCDNNSVTDTLEIQKYDKSQKHIELLLTSKKACITLDVTPLNGGSSGWKTFFIIVFMIIFVYFVGGILFKKIFLDAHGMEVLPNHWFWINVIESVVDFLQYVANGCRRPSSMYNEI